MFAAVIISRVKPALFKLFDISFLGSAPAKDINLTSIVPFSKLPSTTTSSTPATAHRTVQTSSSEPSTRKTYSLLLVIFLLKFSVVSEATIFPLFIMITLSQTALTSGKI